MKRKVTRQRIKKNDEAVDNRIFVSNLNFKVNDDIIKEALKEYGNISNIKWFTSGGQFAGKGVITFETVEQANKALQADGKEVLGRPLFVRNWTKEPPGSSAIKTTLHLSRPPSQRNVKLPGATAVYVTNLPFEVKEDQTRNLFSECGNIREIRWVEKAGKFTGSCFIEYETSEELDKAVAKNGVLFEGRPLRIDYAKPRRHN